MRGFIAFLDILGFSNLILYGDFKDKFGQYSTILKKILRDEHKLSYITLSDSLIINTESDEEDQLLILASAISKLSYELLTEMGIPLCGGISIGDYSRYESEGNVMIAGLPILDAVELEKLQDWIGVMLSPKILKKYPDVQLWTYLTHVQNPEINLQNFRWSSTIKRYDKIPLNGSDYDGFSIVPRKATSTTIGQWFHDLVNYNLVLDHLKLCAPDNHTQRKYMKTRQFIAKVHDDWKEVFQSDKWLEYLESIGDVNHFTYTP